MKRMIDFFEKPVRLDLLDRWINKKSVKILDVGCGNHSATLTKKYYPNCLYYGLDRDKYYNNNEKDFKFMEKFYTVDLSKSCDKLKKIPNDFFDCIILSHIIEHLENGEEVIENMLSKSKIGGVIYIESPSEASLHLPSMRGTLNFYDDSSHIRVYSLKKIVNLLKKNGFKIVKLGTRRSPKKIIFLPLYILRSLISFGFISGHVFWDITGFSNYIIAKKI